MSLDLYVKCGIRNKKGHFIECNVIEHHYGTGAYLRGSGSTHEATIEELKERFPQWDPTEYIAEQEARKNEVYTDSEVWSGNITHNLGAWGGRGMASKVPLSSGKTLYDILWRPEEHDYNYVSKEYIAEVLEGLGYLKSHPAELKQWNPENGWGNYEGLVEFTESFYNAIKDLDLDEYDYELYASK